METISIPNHQWWFYTGAWYPSCEDMRAESHRLLSFQFVHSGVLHVASNCIVLLLYGSFFEMHHPYGHLAVFLIYEFSVVFGGKW